MLGPALQGKDGVGRPLRTLGRWNRLIGGGHVDLVGQMDVVRDVGQPIAVRDDDGTVNGHTGGPEEAEIDDTGVEGGGDVACTCQRIAEGLAAKGACCGGGGDRIALGAGCRHRHRCRRGGGGIGR